MAGSVGAVGVSVGGLVATVVGGGLTGGRVPTTLGRSAVDTVRLVTRDGMGASSFLV